MIASIKKNKEIAEKLAPLIKDNTWLGLVSYLLDKHDVLPKLSEEKHSGKIIFPSQLLMFRAFDECPWDKLKVVILGQDPYHTPGVADGLAFSTRKNMIPPSLRNIYSEINNSLYGKMNNAMFLSGDLTRWANQGVLLLNTALTVRSGEPESHLHIWKDFTEDLIRFIVDDHENLVFLLWGEKAKKYKPLIYGSEVYPRYDHVAYEAAHPSPLSAAKFLGCDHFAKANNFLATIAEKEEIVW